MNLITKKIMTSRWFMNFMSSHLSTEEEAAQALGSLVTDAKCSGTSGRYFDGFKEIRSSVESRDEAKARAVWEQGAGLAGLLEDRDEESSLARPEATSLIRNRGLQLNPE